MAAEPTTLQNLRTQVAQPREAALPQVRAGFSDLAGFELAQRAAKALAASSLVPKNYQGNLADCVVALELAQRIGASPLMVMQNLYIVHGRPAWSSQFLIAAVNQCGRFTALQYEWTGTKGKDDWACRAYAKDRSTGERVQGPLVSIKTAKDEGWFQKSGSKWQTIPELMLMYRAAGWFARTNAPELTMGLQTQEEAHDIYEAEQIGPGAFTVQDMKAGGNVIEDEQRGEAPKPEQDAEPTERQKVLDAIARTDDEEVAALALDAARETDFYDEAEKAFKVKFAAKR